MATDAASAFFCWLLLPAATLTPMLPAASLKALPARLAALVTPTLLVTLLAPYWLTKISASARPKAKLASAADSAAALSCTLLSPAATLNCRLPEASEPASPSMAASLVTRSLMPTLPVLDWRLSISAIAAESTSMSPDTVGSPLKVISESSDSDLSMLTLTPCSSRSLRMSVREYSLCWMSVMR